MNTPTFTPFPFDPRADAALLRACGYVPTFIPARWYDDGDAENGPRLGGHPAYTEWRLAAHANADHVIIVCAGTVEEAFLEPVPPADWFPPDERPEDEADRDERRYAEPLGG